MEFKFIELCKQGNLNEIKFMLNSPNHYQHSYNKKVIISPQTTRYLDIHAKDESGFVFACSNGHLNIVEYLINLYKTQPIYGIINIHVNDDLPFRVACRKNHMNIIKYLINLYEENTYYGMIDIHIYNEDCFVTACGNNHRHTIKYLLNLHKKHIGYGMIDITANNGEGWRSITCYTRIVKFLLTLGTYKRMLEYDKYYYVKNVILYHLVQL